MNEKIRLYHYLKIINSHNSKSDKLISAGFKVDNPVIDEREAINALCKVKLYWFMPINQRTANKVAWKAKPEYVEVDNYNVNLLFPGDALISGGWLRLGLITAIYNDWNGAIKIMSWVAAGSLGTFIYQIVYHVIIGK